jgi:hypothetical protein
MLGWGIIKGCHIVAGTASKVVGVYLGGCSILTTVCLQKNFFFAS